MPRRLQSPFVFALGVFLALMPAMPQAAAQGGSQGSVVVTVDDTTQAVVPEAALTLVSTRTNDTRTALSGAKGTYTFVNLPIGEYRLTVAKPGYKTTVLNSIVVVSSQPTSLVAALPVGAANDTVNVAAGATSLIESSSNVIGTVIDIKQIENLPLTGRSLTSLATLVAGYSGTFNGQSLTNQGNNIDGVSGSPSRGKYNGNLSPVVAPRIEDIEQMSIVTDQLDLNSGFGQATTQLNFITRRGSNQFHGRAFNDFRNSALNANTWSNNRTETPRPNQKYNDFGVSIGGPILHDKLFFFGTFASLRNPQRAPASQTYLGSAAQTGIFSYGSNSVNILTLAHTQNPGLTNIVNSDVSTQLATINSSVQGSPIVGNTDPNLSSVFWNTPNSTINYYPLVRVDYTLSSKARMNISWMMTKSSQPGQTAPFYPGAGFSDSGVAFNSKNYISNYGFDYTFTPRLINQLKAGFLYDANIYTTSPLYITQPDVNWAYGNSGQSYRTPSGHYYPLFNLSDSMTWQHGAHNVSFGGSWYREQDHYYNNPVGFTQYTLGVAGGDSQVMNAINNQPGHDTLPGATNTQIAQARALYATLTGRITAAAGQNTYFKQTGAYSKPGQTTPYNLDEVMSSSAVFAQDSWKVLPNLTLNYGLRWDFVGEDKDLTGVYHSSTVSSIYGPTPVGALFQPGVLGGNADPSYTTQPVAYMPWKVTPQPAFGFAWSPKASEGMLKSLIGSDTVIRGGYALRRYTEPEQFVWDYTSSYGSFFYQSYSAIAALGGAAGTFTPGTKFLGGTGSTGITSSDFALTPATYLATEPHSDYTFNPSAPPIVGIDRNIKQPYVQSWNLGIQRSLGHHLALEVRYNGNRSVHQWIAIDPNEVNIFENGILKEFKNAQANLAAGNGTSYSSSQGVKTPILDAAYGGPNGAGYQDPDQIYYLQTGQVGNFAGVLAGASYDNPTYFCNLVGANFAPCANNLGLTGGGTYPINFFQANPYAAGASTGYLTAAGYSNYNGLQVDLRQGSWHGLQYDANYTYSKSLGVSSKTDYTAAFNAYTLRDIRKSYTPSQFDLRHVFHASGTYDLPFGKNHDFFNHSDLVDRVLGHWVIGSIITFETGAPFTVAGQNQTYNDIADGGVTLTGVTAAQLQKSVGVHPVPGQVRVNILDPKYIVSGQANPAYLNPNAVPGTIAQIIVLHGPHSYAQDLSLNKSIPLFEKIVLQLQGEATNVWNHPLFGNTTNTVDGGVQDATFGTSLQTNGGRIIEIRANIEF
jgi:hypothetical protein